MARRQYKCETLKTDSVGTIGIKKVLAELRLVDAAGTNELTVPNLGSPPNGTSGTVWVEISNVETNPFVVGANYYITFTPVT